MPEDLPSPFTSRFGRWVGSNCSCCTLLLGLIVVPLLLYFCLIVLGGLLIVADPIEMVDAVVVLSGGTGDRIALAIDMLENGFTQNMVITDTNLAANERLWVDAFKGVGRESIYITDLAVESTYEEALAVRNFALSQGWGRLMIVTDP